MFVHIVDADIYLKMVDRNDAKRLFQLIDESRYSLREWLPWLDHTNSVADTMNYIRESRKSYAKHRSMNTAIVYKDQIVGIAGFNEFDWANKSTSIGYWLAKKYEGRGIVTRVVAALIDFAFKELNLNRVEIRVAEENLKSRAIPERLGLKKEGCLREAEWLYDHFVDHIVYGVIAKDWQGI